MSDTLVMYGGEHLIDLNADPVIPERWRLKTHTKGGLWLWNRTKVELYLSDSQRRGYTEGHTLRQELAGKPVLNANALDFLLGHKYLIPEQWKKKVYGDKTLLFFWGTLYHSGGGFLCIRCLYWDNEDDDWCQSYHWLDSGWHGNAPAVLFSA